MNPCRNIILWALVFGGCGRVEVAPIEKSEYIIERQSETPIAFKGIHDAFGLVSIRGIKNEAYSLTFSSDVYDVVFRLSINGDRGSIVKFWRFRPNGSIHKQTVAIDAANLKRFRETVAELAREVATAGDTITPGGIMFYFEIKNGDSYRAVSSSSAQDVIGKYNKIFDWFDDKIAPN